MALIVYQGGTTDIPELEDLSSNTLVIPGKKFVGLTNQGATCYLNGLLQTLFMTPEFRKAMFLWNYNREKDGKEEFCIPLQLQRLFGLLQLSKSRAVDTVALTKSFGWEGSEVFQQQDVQELTRVLFDALEETFKGTEFEKTIDDLYAGELIDYIRCIDVDYQSERVDKFLDFSLAIVPFGETKAMKSLSECIEMFLRPEILDGDNKYFCEKYNQKVDAIKGLKFGRLPQIMSVQLKRFVYDFSGDYVVQKKLNDQVKFPMVLDMNKYIAKKRHVSADGTAEEIVNEDFELFLQEQMNKLKKKPDTVESEQPEAVIALSDIDLEDTSKSADVPLVTAEAVTDDVTGVSTTVTTSEESDVAVVYTSMEDADIEALIQQRGEWVYELYAVLIHSGSVTGGHYYAYIKDLDSKKWYNFNDGSVLPINEKEVQEAWGGKSLYSGSSAYHSIYGTSKTTSYSSANGYMLMYRKVGIASPVVSDDLIPQYIRDLVQAEEEKRIARQKEEDEIRNRLRIRIHWDKKETLISLMRNDTVKEALAKIWEEFDFGTYFARKLLEPTANADASTVDASSSGEEKGDSAQPCDIDETSPISDIKTDADEKVEPIPMNLDFIRLREFNHITKLRTATFDCTGALAEKRLSDLYFSEYKHYIIETRKADEVWEEYYQDGISILMEEFDANTLTFKEPRSVRLPKGATLGDFKAKIASMISFNIEHCLVSKIVALAYNDGRQDILSIDTLRLREDYTVYEGGKLVVEDFTVDAESKQSLAFRTFINAKNKIDIHYNVPPSGVFDQVIVTDGRWKIKEFRQKIADAVGLPVEECRIFKMNNKGVEFKDTEISLSNSGVYNHMNLLVKRGVPTPPGFYPVVIYNYTARDYVPGVTELPAEDPLDIAAGIQNGKVEIVNLYDDDVSPIGTVPPSTRRRVDPWTTAVDDAYAPSSINSSSRAAAGINPYQTKIPSEFSTHRLSSINEVGTISSDHSNIDQLIDEEEDSHIQVATAIRTSALGDIEEDNEDDSDALSNQCMGEVADAMDGDVDTVDLEDIQLNEDEMLLQEALVITASYPVVDPATSDIDNNGLKRESSNSSTADIALARPIMTIERAISREDYVAERARSRSASNSSNAHVQSPTSLKRQQSNTSTDSQPQNEGDDAAIYSTPARPSKNNAGSISSAATGVKSYEAEDVEVLENAHRRVVHLSELQDRAQLRLINQQEETTFAQRETAKKLLPLDLAVVDNTYSTTNPTNPFKDDFKTPEKVNRLGSTEGMEMDDIMAAIAAIDAAVERANLEASQTAQETNSNSNIDTEASTPLVVGEEEKVSDFGERMVKNLIVPEQFQELVDLNSLHVAPSTTVAEFRQQIHSECVRHGIVDASFSVNRLRLREKIGACPAKILRDGNTLQGSNIYLNDHKAFCIELLAEEETLPENDDYGDVVVQVQKWHRPSWSLSEKIDVLLPGGKAVRDIASGLSKLFQIPFEHIRILVVPRDSSLMLSDLGAISPSYSRSWFDPRPETRLLRHMGYDMKLIEGDLLLLQDASEPLMELSDADKRSIAIVQAAQNNPNYSSSSSMYADGTSSYSYPSSSSSNKVPWVGSPTTYQYPTIKYANPGGIRGSSSSTAATSSSSSKGIRIKTQKDRQREATEIATNGDKDSSANTSAGRTSPVDYITGDATVNYHRSGIAVGTEDDFFGTTGGDHIRGRYADDEEYMRQGGPALFADLD